MYLLAGCTVELVDNEEKYVDVFFASTQQMRTSLQDCRVVWCPGDAIKVHYSNSGNDYRFTVVGNPDGEEAVFHGLVKESDLSNSIEGIMYPYTDLSSFWWLYWSHVQIPAEQPFVDGGFAPGINPALGRMNKGNAVFYNAGALLRVSVSGDVSLSGITLRGLDSESVCGEYKFKVYSGIELEKIENELTSVSVLADPAVDVSGGKTFVFVVSPVTFKSGFSLTFTDGFGRKCVKQYEKPGLEFARANSYALNPVILSEKEFGAVPESSGFLANGDFELEVSSNKYVSPIDGEWRYAGGWYGSGSTPSLYWSPDQGVGGSGCLVIDSNGGRTDLGFSQMVSGLELYAPYVFSAMVKVENVDEMSSGGYKSGGANLSVVIEDETWPTRSAPVIGTSDWKEVRVEFEPTVPVVTVRLKLGATAADACGKVWFDDASLEYNDAMYICKSDHVRLLVEQSYVDGSVVTQQQVEDWLSNLDRVYAQYKNLFKGKEPAGPPFITIRSATIDAWAYAGNPIQWNRNYITSTLNQVSEGDWSFGLMHELGHDFAPYISDATYAWDFNEEIFANFRMFYAIDHIGEDAVVVNSGRTYHGREILGLYKSDTSNCYDKVLAKNRAVEMGNALTWCFVRMVDEFGWGLWEDTFEDLYSIPSDAVDTQGWTQWDKFCYLVDALNRHVPQGRDVRETFPEGELDIVEAYLKTQQ